MPARFPFVSCEKRTKYGHHVTTINPRTKKPRRDHHLPGGSQRGYRIDKMQTAIKLNARQAPRYGKITQHAFIKMAIASHELTDSEKVLLCHLTYKVGGDTGVCWPSQERLATELDWEASSIKRAVSGLRKKGWLTVIRSGPDNDRSTNCYRPDFSRIPSNDNETPGEEAGPEGEDGREQPAVTPQPLPRPTAPVEPLRNAPKPLAVDKGGIKITVEEMEEWQRLWPSVRVRSIVAGTLVDYARAKPDPMQFIKNSLAKRQRDLDDKQLIADAEAKAKANKPFVPSIV